MPKTIAVTVATNAQQITQKAKQIARNLQLPYIDDKNNNIQATDTESPFDYLLVFTENYLGLKKRGTKKLFRIDFLAGQLQYRSQKATRRNELLARAIGIKPNQAPSILDATAGLGRDSFILATLGYSVTLLERAPIIHLLLADAIANARSSQLAPIMSRLTLINADAIDWLHHDEHKRHKRIDIIYLDPMFPKREKSASVKKESLILQDLLPLDNTNDDLLKAALTCANKRVVIKRPRLSGNLANQKPSFSLKGNSCRFDVYLV